MLHSILTAPLSSNPLLNLNTPSIPRIKQDYFHPTSFTKVNNRNIAKHIIENRPQFIDLSIGKQPSTNYKNLLKKLPAEAAQDVTGLNLRNNTKLNLKALINILKKFSSTKILDLSYCKNLAINEKKIINLPHFMHVKEVFIGKVNLHFLKNIYYLFPNLEKIHCSDDYRVEEMKAQILEKNPKLTSLTLGKKELITFTLPIALSKAAAAA